MLLLLLSTHLMANIKNELVLRGVEDIMQGYCDVSDSQTGPQVPPSAADIVDDILSQLFAQLLQLPPVEVLDVHWEVDCV